MMGGGDGRWGGVIGIGGLEMSCHCGDVLHLGRIRQFYDSCCYLRPFSIICMCFSIFANIFYALPLVSLI